MEFLLNVHLGLHYECLGWICPWWMSRDSWSHRLWLWLGAVRQQATPGPMHSGTSHIGSCWHVLSGRAALGLSFRECERGNGEICPFGFKDNVLLTRGSRPRYFYSLRLQPRRQLSFDSLLGKGGFCRFHFGWSFRFPDYIPPLLIVNKVWRLQCGQIF